jgi:hypothetical protein
MLRAFLGAILLSLLPASVVQPAEAPTVRSLETQLIGDITYFRVAIDAPADLHLPGLPKAASETLARRAGQVPRLLPQDSQAVVFCTRKALTFTGRLQGEGKPKNWLLDYPIAGGKKAGLAALTNDAGMKTVKVRLDWDSARPLKKAVLDLEGEWANACARHLAMLEARAPGAGVFTLARQIIGRRHGIQAPPLTREAPAPVEGWKAGLYELTTGAEAITESLALRRVAGKAELDRGERLVRVSAIAGIDVPSHPWEKMLGGKKPQPEPLAELVPEDNYYLTVSSLHSFATALDLLERWGGNVMRSFVLHDRDHGLRQRYETQLCLRATELADAIPARLLRSAALTGHDLYLQDGSDLAILFDTTDAAAFVKAMEPYLARARKAFGGELEETSSTHGKTTISSLVTLRRELSLHRAVIGNVVVCSNSEKALHRILDTHTGTEKSLASALDFQYMRTVFARGEKEEDGFAFLSDAFVRQLVGPASRIKAKRRIEARSALTLASHAALAGAWQTGKLPVNHREMLAGALLDKDALDVPDGKPVVWDGDRGQAYSEVYNTLAFTTPLVELPLDSVTLQERYDYDIFRRDYLRLWRRFFDPVGIRFKLEDEQVRVETYILPLITSSRYNDLRWLARGQSPDDPARFRKGLLARLLLSGNRDTYLSFQFDDNATFARDVVEWAIRHDLNPSTSRPGYEKLFWQAPLVMTIGSDESERVSQFFTDLWRAALAGSEKEPMKLKYRGVTIREASIDPERYQITAEAVKRFLDMLGDFPEFGLIGAMLRMFPDKEAPKAFYAATIDREYFLSWNKTALERAIDATLARKAKPAGEDVNAGLRISPRGKAATVLQGYLEWQTHRQALGSVAVWEALRRAGLDPTKQAEVRRLLGYVPISPDGNAFEIDKGLDEVRNARHGSLSRPIVHDMPAPGSPVAALLRQVKGFGVQLRFREDGVQTVLTLERAVK